MVTINTTVTLRTYTRNVFASGYGWSSLRTNRSWSQAVDDAKEAAAQRERDLDEELKVAHGADRAKDTPGG